MRWSRDSKRANPAGTQPARSDTHVPAHIRAFDPTLTEDERILAKGEAATTEESWRLYTAQKDAVVRAEVDAELARLKALAGAGPPEPPSAWASTEPSSSEQAPIDEREANKWTRAETVERIAREVAAHIELKLEQQLITRYGPNWLAAVNEQLPEGKKIRSLSDHRSCLAVFGHNRATAGWVSEDQREMARELSKLASKAHHDHSLTYRDVARARSIGAILREFDKSPRRLYGRANPTRNTS